MLTNSHKLHAAFFSSVLLVGFGWHYLPQAGVSGESKVSANTLIQCVPITAFIKSAKTVEDLVQIAKQAGVSEDLARLEFESSDQDVESIREEMLYKFPDDYGCP